MWHLNKLELLLSPGKGVEMLAEDIKKTPHICLHAALLGDAVQGDERGDVMTSDPHSRLQINLQVVRLQVSSLMGSRQRHADPFTLTSLNDVIPTWRHH